MQLGKSGNSSQNLATSWQAWKRCSRSGKSFAIGSDKDRWKTHFTTQTTMSPWWPVLRGTLLSLHHNPTQLLLIPKHPFPFFHRFHFVGPCCAPNSFATNCEKTWTRMVNPIFTKENCTVSPFLVLVFGRKEKTVRKLWKILCREASKLNTNIKTTKQI